VNRGVVFVHGVGDQRKSDTLLDLGDPLFGWLQKWYAAFGDDVGVRVGRTSLSFSPVDVGLADTPPWTTFEFADRHWSIAEVWWAESNRKPTLATMLWWSLLHLWDIIANLTRSVAERVNRFLHPEGHPTQPARWVQAIDVLNCLGLLILYPLLAIVGYVLLIPLIVVVLIPIPALQNWILLRIVQPMLVINAGEFRMYLEDEVQAANVRRRVADSVDWLADKQGCTDIIIIAHSEGCVVSFGMLTDTEFRAQADKVSKFISVGAGLNKSWVLKPGLKRLHGPLAGDTLWVDIWASFDPVPAGALDPPKGTHIYAPTGEAARQIGKTHTPISLQVTNEMNVLTDHLVYWRNDEQVLVRLAAEIDAVDHQQSPFWAGDWAGAARDRRRRVSILALMRAVAVIGALFSTAGAWLELVLRGVPPWTSLANVQPAPVWVSAPVGALRWLDGVASAVLPPIAALVQQILAQPAYLASAVVLVGCWWAAYRLVRWIVWDPWDRRARAELVRAAGAAAREHVAQTPTRAALYQPTKAVE
jgi:hypothetical protein